MVAANSRATPAWPASSERQKLDRIVSAYAGKQLIKVRDRLYTAVGYGVSNMILADTGDGLVIIDTTDSQSAARSILADFRKISSAPIKAIIYTHHHMDHILGGKAVFADGAEVLAHQSFFEQFALQGILGKSGQVRGAAMFGASLSGADRLAPNISDYPAPVAISYAFEPALSEHIILPTKLYEGEHFSFQLGGITFNLIHTPGETADHTIVHMPGLEAVACGDIFYPSFPNLYTIRGCGPRPVTDWAEAEQKIIDLEPEHLLQGHGFPLQGKETIRQVLSHYKEAIEYVHDTALAAVQSFTPIDEAVKDAALPGHLADLPYLIQSYGYAPFCVRSIYNSYVGWFDGDPLNLSPLTRRELGREVIALAGSTGSVVAQARQAQEQGRHQAVLELCEMVLLNDADNIAAAELKAESLMALSCWTANMPAANYYRSFAAKTNLT